MTDKPNEKPPAERVPGAEGLKKMGALGQRILAVKKTELPKAKKKR